MCASLEITRVSESILQPLLLRNPERAHRVHGRTNCNVLGSYLCSDVDVESGATFDTPRAMFDTVEASFDCSSDPFDSYGAERGCKRIRRTFRLK